MKLPYIALVVVVVGLPAITTVTLKATGLEVDPIPSWTALVGVLLAALATPLLVRVPLPSNGRHSRWTLPILALFSFSFSSYLAVGHANAAFDDHAGERYSTVVRDRPQHERRGSRSRGEVYFLELDPFLPEHGEVPVTFEVSKSIYRRYQIGDPVQLQVRPGYFGYRWIDGL